MKTEALKPPRLATWLLDQFASVVDTPLAGDLMESFQSGRSRAWYWRQVLLAIVIAFPRLLRKQRGRLAYVTCFCLLILALPTWNRINFVLRRASVELPWPWSMVSVIALVSLFHSVIVGVALLGDFSLSHALRRFLQSHIPNECRCSRCGFEWTPYTEKPAQVLQARNLAGAFAIVLAVLVTCKVAVAFLSVFGEYPYSNWYSALSASALWSLQTVIAFLIGVWWIRTSGGARRLSPTQSYC